MPQALSTIIALFVAAAASFADPPALKLPAEVRGEPSAFITVKAETEGKVVRFVALTDGLSVFPAELLRDSKVTVVVAARPGKYKLLAYTAKADEPSEPAITTVVIEGSVPPPPIPPGPVPPIPPEPSDPLTKKIREALSADAGAPAQKKEWAAALGGFYAAMAAHVKNYTDATVGDLLSDYRNAIPAVLPADAIPGTRKIAGQEVATVAGDDAERKIDAALKAKLIDLFTRLSAAMRVEASR